MKLPEPKILSLALNMSSQNKEKGIQQWTGTIGLNEAIGLN
jgi:hypothetical protein